MTASDFRVQVTGLLFFFKSLSQVLENLRQIPLVSQLSFYVGYFWSFQMVSGRLRWFQVVLGRFQIVLGGFRSFQVVLDHFSSFLTLVSTFSRTPFTLSENFKLSRYFRENRAKNFDLFANQIWLPLQIKIIHLLYLTI